MVKKLSLSAVNLDAAVNSIKVAIYIRVSTHWQIDKDSLPLQRSDLINYCKIILGPEHYVVFEDAGYPARHFERPVLH